MNTTEESFSKLLAEDSDLSACQTLRNGNGFLTGHTIPSKEVVLTQQECATLCYGTENCTFWQWSEQATVCWLKSKFEYDNTTYSQTQILRTGLVIGSRACGAPLGNKFFVNV